MNAIKHKISRILLNKAEQKIMTCSEQKREQRLQQSIHLRIIVQPLSAHSHPRPNWKIRLKTSDVIGRKRTSISDTSSFISEDKI